MRLRARYLGLVAAGVIAALAPTTARAAGYQVSTAGSVITAA